jgi:hypothetical protein
MKIAAVMVTEATPQKCLKVLEESIHVQLTTHNSWNSAQLTQEYYQGPRRSTQQHTHTRAGERAGSHRVTFFLSSLSLLCVCTKENEKLN